MISLTLPEQEYPELFIDAALSGIFADGKALSDALPLTTPDIINKAYNESKNDPDFDMQSFYNKYFKIKGAASNTFVTDVNMTLEDHIDRLWSELMRQPDVFVNGSSLIPLPHRYIVPGGRFNEIYYWDSYFTMLGLKADGRVDLIQNMVDNFSFLIHEIGFIPNGNRTYFLSRSQPPFFGSMVQLLASMKGKTLIAAYLPAMLLEYDFWMKGKTKDMREGDAVDHVVCLGNNLFLNKYHDQLSSPRSEMWHDDIMLAHKTTRDHEELYKNIRAACESGWDFSSRWIGGDTDLTLIHTCDIIPVDLNCLLYQLENTISEAFGIIGDTDNASKFNTLANDRKSAIEQFCYDADKGYYFDYNYKQKSPCESITVAGIFPLTYNITSHERAGKCLKYMKDYLLKPGGLVTTNINSGQQWDAPNGWAPLQWMAFVAANNYSDLSLANDIVNRWTDLNEAVFRKTGKMMEKYNVEDLGIDSGGGEYPVQDGFGWTNGVYKAMKVWQKINNHSKFLQ